MKQIIKYQVKNLITNKNTYFYDFKEAKAKAVSMRKLGIGALVYKITSGLYADDITLVEI